MPANLENSAVAQDWKRSVFIPIPKKGNAKECSNYRTIALVSHASKVMLRILQARLQQYVGLLTSRMKRGYTRDLEDIKRIIRNTMNNSSHINLTT